MFFAGSLLCKDSGRNEKYIWPLFPIDVNKLAAHLHQFNTPNSRVKRHPSTTCTTRDNVSSCGNKEAEREVSTKNELETPIPSFLNL